MLLFIHVVYCIVCYKNVDTIFQHITPNKFRYHSTLVLFGIINWHHVQSKYVADKADRLKCNGTMTKWPVQNKQHNTKHAEQDVISIKHDMFFFILKYMFMWLL